MSLTNIMIASGLAALAFVLGRLLAQPKIHRLRDALRDSTWINGHDPITGLLNRVGLYGTFIVVAEEGDQPVTVMLLDLDGFKNVNDTHGHHAGDRVLHQIGTRIQRAAEIHGGTAARLSGDEYAVLLPVREHSIAKAPDLIIAVIADPIDLDVDGMTVRVRITASAGVVNAYTSQSLDSVILHHADLAMYHSKKRGGNLCTFFEPGMAMPANRDRRGVRLRDHRQHDEGGRA